MTSERSNKIKPELLAPAGNIDTFYSVLNAGADAVYMAGNRFGARAYAENFSDEDLIGCIRYAHLYNKKIYLTVNTLIKNEEMSDLVSFLEPLYTAGLDGVIVQDLGVLKTLKSTYPDLQLHASTQLSVTGSGAVSFLKEMGVCRVVPARELDLTEIAEIKETGVEVECFIHGAMCYSYSGQCLFSSCLGGRSGNRGRCAQPCRLPYGLGEAKEIYPLSLKDMQTVDILPELIDAGIDSFKIEGRMKKPEYAAGVTAIYRKYIDEYFEKGSVRVSDGDRKILNSLYIRSEISNGYYHKYNGPDMISIKSPAYSGTDEQVLQNIRENYVGSEAKKKLGRISVSFVASFIEGENAFITASSGDSYVSLSGRIVDTAKSRPISEEDINKSLSKLGNTVFCISDVNPSEIYLSDSPYYSLKDINELRRSVIELLEDSIIESNGFCVSRILSHEKEGSKPAQNAFDKNAKDFSEFKNAGEIFCVSVNELSQLETVISNPIKGLKRIYITEKMYTCDKELLRIISECEIPIFVSLPYIRRNRSYYLREYVLNGLRDGSIKGVLVRNLEDLWYFRQKKNDVQEFEIVCDAGMYSWNYDSADVLGKCSDRIVLPFELSAGAHKELARNMKNRFFEKLVYGRYPLMQSANCVFNTSLNCRRKQPDKTHWTSLKDRTGRSIPVMADCLHCHNTVYNTVPLSVYKLSDYVSVGNIVFRIDFTNETSDQVSEVICYYNALYEGKQNDLPRWEYTTGFEKKSTE